MKNPLIVVNRIISIKYSIPIYIDLRYIDIDIDIDI